MSGEFTDLFAVVACGAVVAVAEAVTIPLLRRAAIIDVPGHRSSHTVPTPGGGGIPMGQQGRYYVEKYFDRGMLARLYRKFLDSPGGRQ